MGQISEGGGESSWNVQEYVLEPILRDEEFVLYRARHRNQADIPSVLVRTPISTRPAPESLKRIEHEYSFRAELDPVWLGKSIDRKRTRLNSNHQIISYSLFYFKKKKPLHI